MMRQPIDAIIDDGRAVLPLLAQLTIGWIPLYILIHHSPEAAKGTLTGAGIGATIAFTIYWNNRRQSKRDTTLDLFKEYYSADFAKLRRRAEKFMARHDEEDWSKTDPYEVGRDDTDLPGYGAVLRYWQRVSTLYKERELDSILIQRLLARELGHWQTLIFEPVFIRRNIFVRELIGYFVHVVSNGPQRDDFKAGVRDGKAMKRKNVSALQSKPARPDKLSSTASAD